MKQITELKIGQEIRLDAFESNIKMVAEVTGTNRNGEYLVNGIGDMNTGYVTVKRVK